MAAKTEIRKSKTTLVKQNVRGSNNIALCTFMHNILCSERSIAIYLLLLILNFIAIAMQYLNFNIRLGAL